MSKFCIALAILFSSDMLSVLMAKPPHPYQSYFAFQVGAANHGLGGEAPAPVVPDSDECMNCGGDGILGDGRTAITCQECDGTGKRKKSSQSDVVPGWPPRSFGISAQETFGRSEPKPLLLYWSSKTCTYCRMWEEQVRLQASKEFKIVKGFGEQPLSSDGLRKVPTFQIRVPGKPPKNLIGYQNISNLRNALSEVNWREE